DLSRLDPIIRCFLRDDDVVHVAFSHAGRRDANERRLALERRHVLAAAIAHPRAKTTDELVDHRLNAALVRDAALDALRHELLAAVATALEVVLVLEVPVAAAGAHRANRAHAAVFLEAPALEQDDLTRALVRAREETADHRRAGADGQRLHD